MQRYVDHESLTPESTQELYALYSYMIDLHISQIRPQNLKEKSYIPYKFNQMELLNESSNNDNLNQIHFEHFHRWRDVEVGWRSQTQDIDYQ